MWVLCGNVDVTQTITTDPHAYSKGWIAANGLLVMFLSGSSEPESSGFPSGCVTNDHKGFKNI